MLAGPLLGSVNQQLALSALTMTTESARADHVHSLSWHKGNMWKLQA